MPTYCISRFAHPGVEHQVHCIDANCHLLPPPTDRRPLGIHPSAKGAIAVARRMNLTVRGCIYCAPEGNRPCT